MMQKSMSRIDWQKGAAELDCLIRGLISWPGASTMFRGKTLKIWEEQVAEEEISAKSGAMPLQDVKPGTVVGVDKEAFYVQTGKGILKITAVQPEGRKRMAVKDFLLGYPVKAGEKLG